MKFGLIILAALVFFSVAAVFLLTDQGYVIISFRGYLIEMAVLAAPENKRAHGARAAIYTPRRSGETSLMAHGIFGFAARESEAKA